jgi:hypothetical protein
MARRKCAGQAAAQTARQVSGSAAPPVAELAKPRDWDHKGRVARSFEHVTLCGKELHGVRHMCAFFDTRDQQYELLVPYLLEGLQRGDRIFNILDSKRHAEDAARLESAGVPIRSAIASDQYKMLASEDTYVAGGAFVMERMCEMVKELMSEAERAQYPYVRGIGEMDWMLEQCEGVHDFIEYEARVNEFVSGHDCTLLCAYDLGRFNGRVIADALATHSHVLLNGQVFENPHYVEPITFLKKLALRRHFEPLARTS